MLQRHLWMAPYWVVDTNIMISGLVGALNQEKTIVGAFSMITKLQCSRRCVWSSTIQILFISPDWLLPSVPHRAGWRGAGSFCPHSSLLSCSGDIAAINRTPATHKLMTHPSLLLTPSQPVIIIMFPVILLVLKRFPAIEDVASCALWFSRSFIACSCWLQKRPCPAPAASISVASTPPPLLAGGYCDHQYPIMCSRGGGRPLSISNQWQALWLRGKKFMKNLCSYTRKYGFIEETGFTSSYNHNFIVTLLWIYNQYWI